MAFESVDVGSLQSALSACKDSINHSTTDNLIGKVSNSSIWECDARSSLKDGLSRLVGIRFNRFFFLNNCFRKSCRIF